MAKTVSVYDISQIIGTEATQSLIDTFPGALAYFSTDPTAIEFPSKVNRNEVIVNMFYSGMSYDKIAEMTGMSKRNICRIIANNYNKK